MLGAVAERHSPKRVVNFQAALKNKNTVAQKPGMWDPGQTGYLHWELVNVTSNAQRALVFCNGLLS